MLFSNDTGILGKRNSDGLRYGFKLSFHPPRRLKSAKKNKPSANQHVDVIDNYLANEVALHRVAGPFPLPLLPNFHVSSFGVIPKKGQPGKWLTKSLI